MNEYMYIYIYMVINLRRRKICANENYKMLPKEIEKDANTWEEMISFLNRTCYSPSVLVNPSLQT